MNSNMLKAMRAKKKRAVDPNAPPRPNLLSHDVKIKNQDQSIAILTDEINHLRRKVESLQAKLEYQTTYLQILHSKLGSRK